MMEPWGTRPHGFLVVTPQGRLMTVTTASDRTAPETDADAAALSLMINATGNVNVRLKPLMTVEDIDEAVKKTPTYRAPGQ